MTNPDYTAVVLIIDRSGSMQSIAKEVQSTLEEFVEQQLAEPGRVTFDTVFFNQQVELAASFVDPTKEKLKLELHPSGMTALFDAVGTKIDQFGDALAKLPEEERPGKVIFVIATDGAENSSSDYNQARVAELIGHQRDVYSWDFTFIGANQDAVLTAGALNIPKGSAITFAATAGGTESVLRSMSAYVSSSRSGHNEGYSVADREAALSPEQAERFGIPLTHPSVASLSAGAAPVSTPAVKPTEEKPKRTRKAAAPKETSVKAEEKPKRAPRKKAEEAAPKS